jgi:hypothetical protein
LSGTNETIEIIDPSDYATGLVSMSVKVRNVSGVSLISGGDGSTSITVEKLAAVSDVRYVASEVRFTGAANGIGVEVEYEGSPEEYEDERVTETIELGNKAAGYYALALTSVGDPATTMRGETVRVSLVDRLSFEYDESGGEFYWDSIALSFNAIYEFYNNGVLIHTAINSETFYDIFDN